MTPAAPRAYEAARNNVQKLVDEGVLQPLGDTKYQKTFVATDVVDILTRQAGEPPN